MESFEVLIQDLYAAARDCDGQRIGKLFEEIVALIERSNPPIGEQQLNWAVMRLIIFLVDPDYLLSPPIAYVLGYLVTRGANLWMVLTPMVERWAQWVDGATGFIEACRERNQSSDPASAPAPLTPERIEQLFPEINEQVPRVGWYWSTLHLVCQAVHIQVQYIPEAARLVRTYAERIAQLRELAPFHRDASALVELLDQMAARDEQFAASQPPPAQALAEAVCELTSVLEQGPRADDAAFFNAVRQVMTPLLQVPWAEREAVVVRIGELIRTADVRHVGWLANTAGSLVEAGSNPEAALDAIFERLPDIFAQARSVLNICAALARATGANPDNQEPSALLNQFAPDPTVWEHVSLACLGAIAMLSRARDARARLLPAPALLEQAKQFASINSEAGFLTRMLQVFDNQELIVLSPQHRRGYRARITGVADNFQLHALLAGALVGPVEEGLLPECVGSTADRNPVPGRPLDRRVLGRIRDEPFGMNEPGMWSFLQLWSWRAIQPDGTLPADAQKNRDHWIWNEGIPADIPAFDGQRIVLISAVPFVRSWNTGRMFDGMIAWCMVEEKYSQTEVDEMLHRLADAAALERGRG
jgi:hypothetical protein